MDNDKRGGVTKKVRITERLRKLIVSAPNSKDWKDKFFHIADFIDAEYEAMVAYLQGVNHKDGHDEGFASIDDWMAKHEGTMVEHGWVRGPIGADGELLAKQHTVVYSNGDIGVIVETRFNDDNWFVLVDFGEGKSARFVWVLPKSLTHYHEPTVEDVLRDFGADIAHALDAGQDAAVPEGIVAKYAVKLCLADDGEK